MRQTDFYADKKVMILGLGKSGLHAALLLHKLGANVVVNEAKDLTASDTLADLEALGILCVHGHHDPDMLDESFDFVLKSPGIPYENEMVVKAQEIGLTIITDIELAYQLSEAELIGITGTNGKTTVTTLVTKLLNQKKDRKGQAYAAGNIGVSVSDVVQKAKATDEMVMELSSFQLMGIDAFRVHIAVILNIYAAHLDYHHTREAYIQAKANILRNQTADDFFVYNADQADVANLKAHTAATAIPFSKETYLANGVSVKAGKIYAFGEYIMDKNALSLKGEHNLEDALAAIAVAKLKKVDTQAIVNVLTHFSGVKHRLQYITTISGRKFYNDSKATNSQSTRFALEGFNQPVILLAGGLDRHEDLSQLLDPLAKHVKMLLISGENAEDFRKIGEASAVPIIYQVNTMQEAVQLAYQKSETGDVILLSPASASWDRYDNFEQRGDDFIQAVKQIEEGKD